MGLIWLLKGLVWNKRHFKNILSNYAFEGITYNLDLELFSGKRRKNRTLVMVGPGCQGSLSHTQ